MISARNLLVKIWLLIFLAITPVSFAYTNELNKHEQGYIIIAHPSVNESILTTRNLAKIYALQAKRWANGQRIKAFTFSNEAEFKTFSLSQLNLHPHQLKRVWNRLLFTGVGKPPTSVNNPSEMLSKIRNTQGGIGYIRKDHALDLQGLKVIEVEK